MATPAPISLPMPTAGSAKAVFALTPALVAKSFVAIVCGILALYLLNAGRRDNSPEKLFWAALAALASFFIFLL